jgi:hypothetical protein
MAQKDETKMQGNAVQARDEGDDGEILDDVDIDEPEQENRKGNT